MTSSTSTLQNTPRILERLGVDVSFPPLNRPAADSLFNNGFEEKTRPVALNFLRAFENLTRRSSRHQVRA
ncbi:MAG: hypothetical protein IPO22_23825 [Anaerolineales bacterium]|nr:hypothetical protein [Anaerolineales bacterium]